MDIAHYDTLRHFADSWGLLYMLGIFLSVIVIIFLPGARQRAADAARIPIDDNDEDRRL
jgi:cytochrome c oxidase cbb3-type subunit 4